MCQSTQSACGAQKFCKKIFQFDYVWCEQTNDKLKNYYAKKNFTGCSKFSTLLLENLKKKLF